MALTKEELIGSLRNEIRILTHLCSKVTPEMIDYRPTPKQRSLLELLQYLTIMGPAIVPASQTGNFDGAQWESATKAAGELNFEEVVRKLAGLADYYSETLGAMSEEDFAKQVEMFGQKGSTGSMIVNLVVCGHAAYRTQVFLYLKACGREELNTYNLWAGVDGQM